MENLYALIDKILPMLSTILGAYITYYVTVSSKKNEAKVNAQIRARDEYWIPCSIAIENLQNKVSELSKNENALVSFTGEKSCESETIQLLKYLQANNRIYFYERTRNILKLLEDAINNYENQINSDISAIIDIFCKQYSSMIESFPMYKINNCIDCAITTKKSLFEEIKTVLLTHRQIIWYGQIAHIVFLWVTHLIAIPLQVICLIRLRKIFLIYGVK